MIKYKLQRWWITDGWETKETFDSRDAALRALKGWSSQIIDGTFRVITARGYVVKIRKGGLYKKAKGRTYSKYGKEGGW